MKLRDLVIVAALSAVSLAAFAQEAVAPAPTAAAESSAPPANATPDQVAPAQPAPAEEQRICRRQKQMGSLFATKVCTTRREREAQAAQTQEALDGLQGRPTSRPGGPGN